MVTWLAYISSVYLWRTAANRGSGRRGQVCSGVEGCKVSAARAELGNECILGSGGVVYTKSKPALYLKHN